MEKANKVILNTETLIDLTGDDTVESDVAAGKKFHRYDGAACVGTRQAPSGTVAITPDNAPDSGTNIDVTNTKYVTVPGDAEDIVNNLTFDEGDQMEYASDNYFMRKVIIKKPDTLLPENIKEGIAIAGISGELKEGITPNGTLQITEAGTFDVTEYANVDVIVDDVPEWDGSFTISSLLEEVGYTLGFNISSVDTYTDGASIIIYDGTDATGTEVYNSSGTVSAPPTLWNSINVKITSGNFYMELTGSKIQLNGWTATNVENFVYTSGAVAAAYVAGKIIGDAVISGSITLDA